MSRYVDANGLKQTFCAECSHSIKCEDCDIEYHFEHFPTAEVVEVKHAIWMPIQRGDEGYSAGDFICSCCGKPNKCYSVTDYCASCGAQMQRGKKHE